MHTPNLLKRWVGQRRERNPYRNLGQLLHLDWPLIVGLLLLASVGLVILYSASDQNLAALSRQGMRIAMAFLVMSLLAQVPPTKYQVWGPVLFLGGMLLILAVLLLGVIGKGAQR